MNTYSTTDIRNLSAAIDACGRSKPVSETVHAGLLVFARMVADGATIATIAEESQRSESAVGRTRNMAILRTMLPEDAPAEQVMDVQAFINKHNVTKITVKPWNKEGRTFDSWAAILDALKEAVKPAEAEATEPVAEEATEEEATEATTKSESERMADLLKALQKIARDFDRDPLDVAADLTLMVEAAQDKDAAADAAEMAS